VRWWWFLRAFFWAGTEGVAVRRATLVRIFSPKTHRKTGWKVWGTCRGCGDTVNSLHLWKVAGVEAAPWCVACWMLCLLAAEAARMLPAADTSREAQDDGEAWRG
jgi:hypothetical protein